MKYPVLKSILIGLLFGVLLFVATRFILVLLIIGAIYKLSGKGKWRREQWKSQKLAYVDKIRTMGDEDYEKFKSNFGENHCYN